MHRHRDSRKIVSRDDNEAETLFHIYVITLLGNSYRTTVETALHNKTFQSSSKTLNVLAVRYC